MGKTHRFSADFPINQSNKRNKNSIFPRRLNFRLRGSHAQLAAGQGDVVSWCRLGLIRL